MDDLPQDPFADVVLGHTLFDWSDPTLTAESISKALMGFVDHWDAPEYKGMKPWEIERKILFDARRPNLDGVSKWGKPYFQHMLTLGKLLLPDVDITPALYDVAQFFCISLGKGKKKVQNLIGSQNSGKSFGIAFLAFVVMYIDPERSAVFVANPFDNSADAQIWGTIEEFWDMLCDAHPNTTGKGNPDASSLFPYGVKYANRSLDLIPGLPKAGSIVLKGVKHVGKFKGSKARLGKDVDRGIMMLAVDEINEVDNPAFLTMLNNLVSQDQFIGMTTQNYKDPGDMGGQMTEPVGTYGGPSSIAELDVEEDIWWHSVKSSITLRFDGHKSPNILANRVIYERLFKPANRDLMLQDYGEQSPDYFSQVRSFPVQGDENNSVLSRSKISASRHKDPYFTLSRISGSVAFCDPAFGGRDKAVWGCGHFGLATVTDAEGNTQQQELLVFKDWFKTLSLVKDARYNDWWMDRLKAAGVSIKDFTIGAEVSYEDQIAIQCRELNRSHGVSNDSFGFDFSMRPDIVSSMNKILGFACHAFDYNQGPEGVFLQNIKQNSEDCCKNRCTELAFLAADYFLTKQIRGGTYIETAVIQLSRTLYQTITRKYVAEGKKEYKARWQQVSPDHRDVLMGICGMAARKGFRVTTLSQGNSKSPWQLLNAKNIGKAKIIKRL